MSGARPIGGAQRAIVVGSTGGIGAALAEGLRQQGFDVIGLSRTDDRVAAKGGLRIELMDEASIERAALRLRPRAPFAAIIVGTGLLHGAQLAPEKAIRELDWASLSRLMAVNAIGPALVAKHFVPLLPRRGRSVFAALSARVGSISDNRLGGWYGYRASKAALNMFIRTLAVELARTHPDAICVGLHPGTVDTALSRPFQKGVPAGRLFSPEQAAANLLRVLASLTPARSGRCFAWDGTEIAP